MSLPAVALPVPVPVGLGERCDADPAVDIVDVLELGEVGMLANLVSASCASISIIGSFLPNGRQKDYVAEKSQKFMSVWEGFELIILPTRFMNAIFGGLYIMHISIRVQVGKCGGPGTQQQGACMHNHS